MGQFLVQSHGQPPGAFVGGYTFGIAPFFGRRHFSANRLKADGRGRQQGAAKRNFVIAVKAAQMCMELTSA